MRRILPLLMMVACSSADFEVPARPDMRIERDLSSSAQLDPVDLMCLNVACGGCSSWLGWDRTAVEPGDPCARNGAWMCMGTQLQCSDLSCPTCAGGTMTGSVCGADGHAILDLVATAGGCRVHDFGSAINVCNRGANDKCVGRCTKTGTNYHCVARCVSDDAGGTGCEFAPAQTCDTLTTC